MDPIQAIELLQRYGGSLNFESDAGYHKLKMSCRNHVIERRWDNEEAQLFLGSIVEREFLAAAQKLQREVER